jgi:hypothetical protein
VRELLRELLREAWTTEGRNPKRSMAAEGRGTPEGTTEGSLDY